MQCDSVALVDMPAVISKIDMRTKRGCAPRYFGPRPYVMYDFVNLSRDIAATPFQSVISQVSMCISATATVNTHETVCPASKVKGSLMMKGLKPKAGGNQPLPFSAITNT